MYIYIYPSWLNQNPYFMILNTWKLISISNLFAITHQNVYLIYIFIVPVPIFIIIVIDIVVAVAVWDVVFLESIINRLVHLCINMEWVCTNYMMHFSCKSNTFEQLSIQDTFYKCLSKFHIKKITKWRFCSWQLGL